MLAVAWLPPYLFDLKHSQLPSVKADQMITGIQYIENKTLYKG